MALLGCGDWVVAGLAEDLTTDLDADWSGVAMLLQQREILDVVRATADHVSIDHARLADVDAAADFEVELALCHCRHAQTFHDSGSRWDFDAVAHAGDEKTPESEFPSSEPPASVEAMKPLRESDESDMLSS